MNGGVKEFHLVAEEFEHEFAPGSKAICWGYNGSTPGPTIEAIEGDRVRIFVTNRLKEATTIHWHGLILPSGMDGVGGLSQPQIGPGETYVYEFTLQQHGTHMYHPHADEMVQLAMGMMGLFIIHPKGEDPAPVDRDYAFLIHNFALHPGTRRPDPAIMQDFDLWTFNSKVFPAIDSIVARTGERVRIRMGNLSMWNHPIHLHGVQFHVTGGDGGRWPRNQWRSEVTEIVGVGQMRDIEFTAVPGDWAFHCHMSHHTMGPMGHDLPNTLGVNQRGVEERIRKMLPGYMAMGEFGMAEHQKHTDSGHMQGPPNTLPMMSGNGPFGPLEMGGMFTVVKVRDDLRPGDYSDPGWYRNPAGTVARKVSADPSFGNPPRRSR
jgi:FtsP/CotA-like multicopper oxidase with cupredoxin domain